MKRTPRLAVCVRERKARATLPRQVQHHSWGLILKDNAPQVRDRIVVRVGHEAADLEVSIIAIERIGLPLPTAVVSERMIPC